MILRTNKAEDREVQMSDYIFFFVERRQGGYFTCVGQVGAVMPRTAEVKVIQANGGDIEIGSWQTVDNGIVMTPAEYESYASPVLKGPARQYHETR